MRFCLSSLVALPVLLLVAVGGCAGTSQTATEAREDPADVVGQQRTVLRGTAMREQSSMGSNLVETLRAATATTARPSETDGSPAPGFNTLLAALDAADLTETLQGEGPFTLFAPTDAAFADVPPARLEALLDDRPALRRLLRAHLVRGNLVADELTQRSPVPTLAEGRSLTVAGEDADITIEGVRVLQADAGTANGTIHVLDAVLLPE